MPELLPIAEMEIDRATSRLETTKLNPTRRFAMNTGRGSAFYTWQNGHWFGTGGNYIEEANVPQEFRDEIAANPVTSGTVTGPAVVKICRQCGEQMNAADLDDHYVEHVRVAMQAAGAKPVVEDKFTPKPDKADANQHRR
jgi:hypothetical protein